MTTKTFGRKIFSRNDLTHLKLVNKGFCAPTRVTVFVSDSVAEICFSSDLKVIP